jgi:hypothetical protein
MLKRHLADVREADRAGHDGQATNEHRGRFGMCLPPRMEALGLAELTRDARNNRTGAAFGVTQRDVKPTVEARKKLVGVIVQVSHVLTAGVCDPRPIDC